MVCALAFALVCLAAMPLAPAASSEDGGMMYIPSTASIAHCPSSCGGVDISYPFGIGPGCFRPGFELTCNHTTQPPKLFLGNSTTQITNMYGSLIYVPAMFFNISLEESGTNTYNISWDAATKGLTILSYNIFFFLGCDFDVELFDYLMNSIGSCMSRCHGKVLPNQGPCYGFGCCSISLQNDISGFQGTIVRAGNMVAQSDPLHPGIMAFMSEEGNYMQNATDLFSSWTNASKISGVALEVAIMDQPSCKNAQMNNASYACATNSYCIDELYRGYSCHCYNDYYSTNAYISEGCMQADYNPKPKEHCLRSCGNMSIPFPFGLEEDCSGNRRFRLNCTDANETLFSTVYTQYHVTGLSVEDGTLTVSNVLNNASSGKEVIITRAIESVGVYMDGPLEDQFDFSMEDIIIIKWVVTNLTCKQAMQNTSNYACRSVSNSCLDVTHGSIFMGYRCSCSSGFKGNPYIQDGCIGTSTKQRNLLLGIAIGIRCGIGSIFIALAKMPVRCNGEKNLNTDK